MGFYADSTKRICLHKDMLIVWWWLHISGKFPSTTSELMQTAFNIIQNGLTVNLNKVDLHEQEEIGLLHSPFSL